MADSNTDEPYRPAAFNLPSSSSLNDAIVDGSEQGRRQRRRPLRIVLATTGSVASIKAPLIVDALLDYQDVEVQVVATSSSLAFYDAHSITARAAADRAKNVTVWRDEDEWNSWKQIGDPILHIELRRWADVVLIAPLDANTLAKLANGLCDNLLTSMMRALDSSRTKVYVFPAMNTFMYSHPLTSPQLRILEDTLGYNVVGPIGKGLACGDTGVGAMTEWRDIVRLVVSEYDLKKRPPTQIGTGASG